MDTTISGNIWEHLKKVKSVLQSNTMTCCIILLYILLEFGITAIPYEYRDFDLDVDMVGRGLLYLIIPSLFIETYFIKNRLKYICGYIIAFVISGAVAPLGELFVSIENLPACEQYELEQTPGYKAVLLEKECVGIYLAGTFLILLLMMVYRILKDTKQRWDDYLIKIFLNVAKTMIILIILFIFSTVVDSVMAEELLYHYYYDMAERVDGMILVLDTFYLGPVGVLVIGLYFGIKVIVTIKDMGEKPGKFLHSLGRDVLYTIILCVTGYVYFYMLVMLLAEELYVSAVISGLFAVWLSVVILAGDGAKTRYGKIISIVTALMLPLISLQGCDIAVRICRHGMRPERYVGMILFIFEIIAVFIHYFRKGQYGRLLPLFGLLVVITFYMPLINMNSVSKRWQMSFLQKYYQAACDGEVTSQLAYERLKYSYSYLKWWAEMEEEIEPYNIYEKSFVVKLKEQYPEADLTRSDYHFITCTHMADDVEEAGYSYAAWLKQNNCYDEEGENGIDVDFSCFQFVDNNTGEIITVDISEFVEKAVEYEKAYPDVSDEGCSEAMKEYCRIKLDDDTLLYIYKFHVMYDDGVRNAEPCFRWCSIDISGELWKH